MFVTGDKSILALDFANDSASNPPGPLAPPGGPPGPLGGPPPPNKPGPGGVLVLGFSLSSFEGNNNLNVGSKKIPAVKAPGTTNVCNNLSKCTEILRFSI